MAIDNAVTSEGSALVHSLDETGELASKLLPLMRQAGSVSLEGPLGAGKTHFVKAVASLLGVSEPVSSPTFTLLHSYSGGECPLHHSDWYRLESEEEVLGLGLEEYLDDGFMMIEWGDKFSQILPPGTLRIRITHQSDNSRLINWAVKS
ncbi:MAG: tRNA (adenosine(37)-N6)-threonylcarbamoyltransferase complex ATPase subunit type 1 TsaE [Proteobacteria bacterium]|nr:tRNA (adenosine(37)-N6)-threonylcarbamoyltransferase complex ATPase subunit type 1 TsaE [Pseudomonadota bacterium]